MYMLGFPFVTSTKERSIFEVCNHHDGNLRGGMNHSNTSCYLSHSLKELFRF